MKAVIILGNISKIKKIILNNRYIIGDDLGAYNDIKNGITLDVAIGDFDSISNEMLEEIKINSKKLIKLNPIKDETDTLGAIALCKDYDEILIFGGIKGRRIEHFYANILCLINDKRIKMMDDDSLIETHDKSFIPNQDYKYISFFSIVKNTTISLSGFKYQLNNYQLQPNDSLGISNEIIMNPYVEIHNGRLIVIYSKDDHEKLL